MMKRLVIALSLMLTMCFNFSVIHAEEVTGSAEKLVSQLEDSDFYVQNGYLYEFDTLKLASEGKLLTCFGNNAGSTYGVNHVTTGRGADYYELINDRVIVFHKKQ